MFKQMKMRAAALGMPEEDIQAFMSQGIANTLDNRNMAIEGSKAFGAAFAFAGNVSSTPLTPLAVKAAPIFAVPGVLDAPLMTGGWVVGTHLGMAYGAVFLNRMKDARLKEAKAHGFAVTLSVSNKSAIDFNATYTAASKPQKLLRSLGVHAANIEKHAFTPMAIGSTSQFFKGHLGILGKIGKEVLDFVTAIPIYAYQDGGKGIKDIRNRNSREDAAKLKIGPPSPAFSSCALLTSPFKPSEEFPGNAGSHPSPQPNGYAESSDYPHWLIDAYAQQHDDNSKQRWGETYSPDWHTRAQYGHTLPYPAGPNAYASRPYGTTNYYVAD